MLVLYKDVPNIFLYPPVISGSKFFNYKASPGDIENTSLLRTKPPEQLTIAGASEDVSAIKL